MRAIECLCWLVAGVLLGCDGEITVRGGVSDEGGSPIPQVCIYLADREFNDALIAYLDGRAIDLHCQVETDASGRFENLATVAGDGDHDFWLVAWKEGYRDKAQRVWRDDGFPEEPVVVDVVLEGN